MWVARDKQNSKLAGSYSVIPLRMKLGNKEVTGSLSMNTMTHPDYRKQGIFKVLAEKTFESCQSKNIPITIGLPNANSYPGFTGALKFKDVGSRSLLVKPFNAGFVIDKFIKNKFVKKVLSPVANVGLKLCAVKGLWSRSYDPKVSIVEVSAFGKEFDEFWNKVSKDYNNIVVRDGRFLNWRFVSCPTRNYKTFKAVIQGEMVGYLVVSVDKHHSYDCQVAFIVDLVVNSKLDKDSVYKALVLAAEKWAISNKADFIGMHVPPHLESCKMLKKFGYIDVPKRFIGGSQAMIVRPHLQDSIIDEQALDFSNWFLMDGDNDRP
jgi:hypothetical protein